MPGILYLLGTGINCNFGLRGTGPLGLATRKGLADVAQLLLERGANPNLQDEGGFTPLHGATSWGHTAIAQLLLDRGANPNLQNKYGETPLQAAAAEGHTAIARLLLERGANPNLQDEDGETPLDIAIEHSHSTIIGILLGHGTAIHPHNEGALLNCALNPAGRDNSLLRLLASRGVKLWAYKQRLPADINERQDIIRLFAAGEICAICLGNLVDASALHAAPCGHIFCQECFDHWRAKQLHEEEKVALCASCKSPL